MSKEYPSEHFRPKVGDSVVANYFGRLVLNPSLRIRRRYVVTSVGPMGLYDYGRKQSPMVKLDDKHYVLAVGLKAPKFKAATSH